MLQYHDDSYVLTRVKLLANRLLRLKDWSAVVDSSLEALLVRYHIEATEHDVEKQLIDHAMDDFQLLFRPFSGLQRDLLNYAIHWYELFNLKTLIRGKFSAMSENEIAHELVDLGQFAVLPLPALLQTDDPYEMLRLLEQTPYSSIVRQARSIFEEEGQNLFALDAAIDRHFFSGLMQRTRFLPAKDQQQLKKVFGTMMDQLNLLWLIRYRFTYGLTPAKSYYLLATTGNKLHSGTLMRLARLETQQEVLEQLPHPLNQLLSGTTSQTQIEKLMEHYMLEVAYKTLQYATSSVTRVFSYVLLRESEIRLLQAVIKGKQLNFDNRLIHQAIGMEG